MEEYKQNRLQQKAGTDPGQPQNTNKEIAQKTEKVPANENSAAKAEAEDPTLPRSPEKLEQGDSKATEEGLRATGPLITRLESNQPKIKTDEDIPVLKFQETEKLIETQPTF